MRIGKAITLYAVAVFALSAAIAPWIFWGVHTIGDWPFRRVFNRIILVVAIVGLWPLARAAGIRSWRELGYVPVMSRQLLAGIAIGVVSYATGMFSLHFAGNLWKCAAIGIVVALIEETFFRGGLQNVLQRRMRPWLAVVLVSALYSVLHFLKPSGAHIPDAAVTWRSGFEYLGGVVACSFQEPGLWRSVVSLWLVGVVLGWAFVRTRTLYLSIGLHAGWVFAMKAMGPLVDNPVIWPVLLVVLGGIEWWSRRKN